MVFGALKAFFRAGKTKETFRLTINGETIELPQELNYSKVVFDEELTKSFSDDKALKQSFEKVAGNKIELLGGHVVILGRNKDEVEKTVTAIDTYRKQL